MKFLRSMLTVMATISLGVLMIREANNFLPHKSSRGPIDGTKRNDEDGIETFTGFRR